VATAERELQTQFELEQEKTEARVRLLRECRVPMVRAKNNPAQEEGSADEGGGLPWGGGNTKT
jgi:hypothetical protein